MKIHTHLKDMETGDKLWRAAESADRHKGTGIRPGIVRRRGNRRLWILGGLLAAIGFSLAIWLSLAALVF